MALDTDPAAVRFACSMHRSRAALGIKITVTFYADKIRVMLCLILQKFSIVVLKTSKVNSKGKRHCFMSSYYDNFFIMFISSSFLCSEK